MFLWSRSTPSKQNNRDKNRRFSEKDNYTLLLHAQRRWPDAINTHLWTYAIRSANDAVHPVVCLQSKPTPFWISNLCFEKELQDHKKISKQSDRTRIGINLWYSSRQALNVSLILHLQTGLVSPQYHCQYDDLFQDSFHHHNGNIKQDWLMKNQN